MDKLMLGLSTTGVGMLVVFFGLVILIACIYGMTSITGREKKQKKQVAPAPVPAPAAPVEEPAVEEEADDLSVIAAITAAIACVWQDETTGFVVRRIRRVQNSPAWQRSGREEQILNRF